MCRICIYRATKISRKADFSVFRVYCSGSHLVSRKRSIDWPRYPRNFTCKNANYVMIHW